MSTLFLPIQLTLGISAAQHALKLHFLQDTVLNGLASRHCLAAFTSSTPQVMLTTVRVGRLPADVGQRQVGINH
jgi:hypothetical protein